MSELPIRKRDTREALEELARRIEDGDQRYQGPALVVLLRSIAAELPPSDTAKGTIPAVRATTYTVSCLPNDPDDGWNWDIEVQFAGAHVLGEPRPLNRQWAVRRRGHYCLRRWVTAREVVWDYEPIPSERDDDWFANHRFSLAEALERAKQAAPKVTVNGLTPAGLLKWRVDRRETSDE